MTAPVTLAVFSDIGICDTKHEHPVVLITDGTRAHCEGLGVTVDAVSRDGVKITACCPLDWCYGMVEFDLSEPGTWTADPADLSMLAKYGDTLVIPA